MVRVLRGERYEIRVLNGVSVVREWGAKEVDGEIVDVAETTWAEGVSIWARADDAEEDGSGTNITVATGLKNLISLHQRVVHFHHGLPKRCPAS